MGSLTSVCVCCAGRSHMAGQGRQASVNSSSRRTDSQPETSLDLAIAGSERACNVRFVSHLLGWPSPSAFVFFMLGKNVVLGVNIYTPVQRLVVTDTGLCVYKPKHAQPSSEQTTVGRDVNPGLTSTITRLVLSMHGHDIVAQTGTTLLLVFRTA